MMKMGKAISLLVASVMILSSVAYASNDASAKLAVQEAYGKLPLYFIQNEGQVDGKVKFYEKGNGHATFFTKDGVSLSLAKGSKAESIKLIPYGANKSPEIHAEEMLAGKVNYFIGNDAGKWKTNIQTYKAVVYKELYKGIDMKFYGNNTQLEYDVIVKPGADLSKILLTYEGIEGLEVAAQGELDVKLKEGHIIQRKPVVYQKIDGKRVEVEGKFKIKNLKSGMINAKQFAYGFEVASYNKNYDLVIDPVLVYSTYLGGSGGDIGYSVATDSVGDTYITGETMSTDFPTAYPISGSLISGRDIFVTKINAAGTGFVYSTYLGGSGNDSGFGIAVDSSRNVYVTGETGSVDFPTAAPIQGNLMGGSDAFIAKINVTGSALVYSTFLGGTNWDAGYGIAVDTSGNVHISGGTSSTDFPTANPLQASNAGGMEIFVTKINAPGTNLVYSTYLGGSDREFGGTIAVDSAGNAYTTGSTYSYDYPVTPAAIQMNNVGPCDSFVTKINASGNLAYSTYLGGSSLDGGNAVAVDASGNAYITGWTQSVDFPTVSPIQGSHAGGISDAFVAKINSTGSALLYSTYLGGSGHENYGGWGIAIDGVGNAYITGSTSSSDFPTVSAVQGALAGYQDDTFITKLSSDGLNIVYSTYLGGNGRETGYSIAVDPFGNAYVTGETTSSDFPTLNPIDGTYGGSGNAFVSKIAPDLSGCINLKGSAVTGSAVTLKQTAVPTQNTTTNNVGCYHFDKVVSGKTFTITINGPVVP